MPLTEAQKEYQREYRQRPERRAAMREHQRRWKQANPAKVNAQARRRWKERYAGDEAYRETMKRRARAAYNFEHYLLKTYALSVERYQEMFLEGCGACGDELVPGRSTHVDHDHDSGQVRALLCRGCNVALGQLRDDPKRVRLLADYIERHKGGDA